MTKLSNAPTKSQADAGVSTRRAALKKILAGGGVAAAAGSLPTQWTRPVVDAVVLPAHAATSGPTHFRGTVTPIFSDVSTSPVKRVIDALVPPAYAAENFWRAEIVDYRVDICIDIPDGQHFTVQAELTSTSTPLSLYLTASGTVGGSMVPFSTSCGGPPPVGIQVTSIGPSGANVQFVGELTGTFLIPPGSGCPSKVCKIPG